MKLVMLGILSVIFTGCSTRHISTVWKADPIYNSAFKQVMVVAILPGNDSLERKHMESELAADLIDLEYPAVPAVNYFGTNGFAGMDQESTYVKLCSNGIDYVLTIALVEKTKEQYERSLLYTGSYYYDRIWQYRNRAINTWDNTHQYFYESILFDLAELKALSVLRSHLFYPSQKEVVKSNFLHRLISKMLQEKILIKQPKTFQPRAF